MENFFITALVTAGSRKSHSFQAKSLFTTSRTLSRSHKRQKTQQNAAEVGKDQDLRVRSCHRDSDDLAEDDLSKEDYRNLVDIFYNLPPSGQSSLPSLTPSLINGSGPSQEPFRETTKSKSSHTPRRPSTLQEREAIQRLINLFQDNDSNTITIFQAYKTLPLPGVQYLPEPAIRYLLQRMSTSLRKTDSLRLRYLSVVDDMQIARIPLTRYEWSTAIYLTGRCFSRVSSTEIENSLRLWKHMENEAGVRSNHVTFNILFDIAVKAGKFVLADMILKEMSERGFTLNRFGHVGLIHYYGQRCDGDGVRRAYRDLVEAGEIVDTLVLNSVMSSLLKAGEPTAAEQVYERMKVMHFRSTQNSANQSSEELLRYPPPGSRTIGSELASASLSRLLTYAPPRLRKYVPDIHSALQSSIPLTPDLTTFFILASYHALKSGDLDRLTVLLNDMLRIFELPLHGQVFLILLKGFAIHGGVRYSPWTNERLESVWNAFKGAAFDGSSSNYHGKPFSEATTKSEEVTPEGASVESEDSFRANASVEYRVGTEGHWELETEAQQVDTDHPENEEARNQDDSSFETSAQESTNVGSQTDNPNSEQPNNVFLGKWMIIWTLRAYGKCAGPTRTEQVWDDIKSHWKPTKEKDVAAVKGVLEGILTHGGYGKDYRGRHWGI